jgi:hypothetical protein
MVLLRLIIGEPKPNELSLSGVSAFRISGMPELAAALSKVQKLEKIKIYSPNSDHRRAFAAEWEKKLGLPIIAVDEPRCVVVGSDVVIIVNSKAQIEYA